jgi:hypothetical protein
MVEDRLYLKNPGMGLPKKHGALTVMSVTEADKEKEAVHKLCISGSKAHPAGSKCGSG